jgi:hypothetical protein
MTQDWTDIWLDGFVKWALVIWSFVVTLGFAALLIVAGGYWIKELISWLKRRKGGKP